MLTEGLQADEQGRDIWLGTSDAAGFYERMGFKLVGETWIAKDNTDWDGPPVPIRMVSTTNTLCTHCILTWTLVDGPRGGEGDAV